MPVLDDDDDDDEAGDDDDRRTTTLTTTTATTKVPPSTPPDFPEALAALDSPLDECQKALAALDSPRDDGEEAPALDDGEEGEEVDMAVVAECLAAMEDGDAPMAELAVDELDEVAAIDPKELMELLLPGGWDPDALDDGESVGDKIAELEEQHEEIVEDMEEIETRLRQAPLHRGLTQARLGLLHRRWRTTSAGGRR